MAMTASAMPATTGSAGCVDEMAQVVDGTFRRRGGLAGTVELVQPRAQLELARGVRGEPGGPHDEPQHELMGQITPGLFDLMRIPWEFFPTEESEVANAIAEAYIADKLSVKVNASRTATNWLQERLREIGERVERASAEAVKRLVRAESTPRDRFEPRGKVPLFYPRNDNWEDVRKVLSRFGHAGGHAD